MTSKWRICKEGLWWVVYAPDGELSGQAWHFRDAVGMVDCTPDVWLQRKCQRAALDAWVAECQRLVA